MANYTTRGARLTFSAAEADQGQGLARVTGLANGGFSVTWVAADAERSSFDGDMYGQIFTAGLAPVTPNPVRLLTDTAPTVSYPVNHSVASLATGGFAVFSTDTAAYSPAQNSRDVVLRLYDNNGAATNQPLVLGQASILGVTVTTLEDGRVVAGWIDPTGALRAQYVSEQGAPLGTSFSIAKPAGDIAARPDFTSIASGGWVATYVAQNGGAASAVFYDAAGNVVSSTPIAPQLTSLEGVQTFELADDRVIMVWTRQGANAIETRAQIFTATGSAFSSELAISSTASSVVSVTGLADGGFAIALEGGPGASTEVKLYNSIGQQNGATLTFANAIEPSIASLADGGFVVTWKDTQTAELHAQAYQAAASGNLTLTGGGAADTLVGQEGNDSLSGGAGNDRLFGSVGQDQLFGQDDDDLLDGGAGADSLSGGIGADILNGGLGADQMDGGTGNDWFYVDNAADVVVEAAGAGADRVYASTSYRLSAGAEVELLIANSVGAMDLTGNGTAQYLLGNAAFNILEGLGGADTSDGGAGDDWHIVDNPSDWVIERAGEGYDRVITATSYRLNPNAEVELLLTSDQASTATMDLIGSSSTNTIFGNEGSNTIFGLEGNDALWGFGGNDVLDGGTGSDTMFGGSGNDWYVVDSLGDQVIEDPSSDYDRILAVVDYRIGVSRPIELLLAADRGGSGAINLAGNELSNSIFGNEGVNLLEGYEGDDALEGYGGADILDGGEGRDRLNGGEGADTYSFSSSIATGADRIDDFVSGLDKIRLDDAIFTGLAPGALSSSAFVNGSAATTAAHRLVYDQAQGQLYFDADGAGGTSAVLFATLQPNTVLSATDFFVV